jgi:hypothetical protein
LKPTNQSSQIQPNFLSLLSLNPYISISTCVGKIGKELWVITGPGESFWAEY